MDGNNLLEVKIVLVPWTEIGAPMTRGFSNGSSDLY